MPQRHNKECRFETLAIVGSEWTPLQTPAAVPKEKECQVCNEKDAGWAPEPAWMSVIVPKQK